MSDKQASLRLPQDFQEWRHCIEVLCRIPLTRAYVAQRREELSHLRNRMDQKFVELYGEQHLGRVRAWFEQVWEEQSFASDGAARA